MRYILLLVLLSCVFMSLSKDLELTDDLQDYAIENQYYTYFEDALSELELSDSIQFNWRKVGDEEYLYAENAESTYWLKLDVTSKSTEQFRWTLECMDINIERINYYILKKGEIVSSGILGVSYPFYQRKYQTTNFAIDLDIVQHDKATVILKLKSSNGTGFNFHLRKTQYFVSYAIHEFFILGAFYGILLIIAVYNFLVFIVSREKSYFYYVLYILASVLYSFEENGYGYKFLWPSHPEWSNSIYYFFSPLLFLWTYTLYSQNFLDLKTWLGKMYKTLITVVVLSSIYLVVEFFLPYNLPTFNIFLLPFLLVFLSAVFSYYKGNTFSRYFILGSSFVLISMFITIGRMNDWIPHNIFTVYSFNYAVVIEVVILSLALGDKIKLIKRQRDAAQEEVILQLKANESLQGQVKRELEQKVEERTVMLKEKSLELLEANQNLEELTNQLNEMNSKLDYDNWKLNRTVEEQKNDRFLAKDLPKEEFFQMFPDEIISTKFLSELKWEQGYTCKKCDHINFSVLKNKSRKCTKCAYIESVNANTLFHGIRFPLNKALYMTYLIFRDRSVTIESLMEQLDLGKNTCWKFKNKVLDRMELFNKSKEITVKNWVNILVDRL